MLHSKAFQVRRVSCVPHASAGVCMTHFRGRQLPCMLHAEGGSVQDNEWSGAGEPWNPTSTRVIGPNSTYTFGVRLLTAPSLAQLDDKLLKAGKAVVHGVPGKQAPLGLLLLCSCGHCALKMQAGCNNVHAAGFVVATDTNAQLLVTLPHQAIPLTHVHISPQGAMVAGEVQTTR